MFIEIKFDKNMSRIGKQFIAIPQKVNVSIDGQKIVVDGPKGSLSRILPSLICCTQSEQEGAGGKQRKPGW